MGISLTVTGLEVRGDDGRAILRIEHLHLEPGIVLAIRGPSGAGKSTLLHVIAGLVRVAEGRIDCGGTDIATLGEDQRAAFRRRTIGMVFQDFLLFEELGALGNAVLAGAYQPKQRRAIRDRAGAALSRLGIDPQTSRSVATFSGGERQRVAISRALANDPPVILADEPTASLDRTAADALIDDLAMLARENGKTLVIVSHDIAVHERADRVVDIADGRLAHA